MDSEKDSNTARIDAKVIAMKKTDECSQSGLSSIEDACKKRERRQNFVFKTKNKRNKKKCFVTRKTIQQVKMLIRRFETRISISDHSNSMDSLNFHKYRQN